MALNPRAKQIYELASIWLNECLLNDGSLFWPERQVWTQENLNHFWSAFAENLDEGSGSFVEKWAQQLDGQSDDVHRMAVELTAIYCLFPADKQMGPGSKRKLMNEVLAFRDDMGAMDQSRKSIFDQAIDGGGIGLTGAGYLAARPYHMGMYLGFAKSVKASGAKSLEDLQPKAILKVAFELVSGTMNYRPVSTKHILLHILWPEKFEDYASADYKKKMAKNLSAHFRLPELDDIDESILQAREYMVTQKGFDLNFSMYDDKVESLWNFKGDAAPPTVTETSSHIIREKAPIYEIARLFHERVIEQRRSLLWPDREIWTAEVVDQFIDGFVKMQHGGSLKWTQLYRRLTDDLGPESAMIIADSYAFLMQFPSSFRGVTKSRNLDLILGGIDGHAPDSQTLASVKDAFDIGVGSAGPAFNSAMAHQFAFVPVVVRQFMRNDGRNFQETIDQAQKDAEHTFGFSKQTLAARNIILHLLNPERYERIASQSHKSQIVEAFQAQLNDLSLDSIEDVDAQIREIRQMLAGSHFVNDFDFYDEEVEPYWDGDRVLGDTDDGPVRSVETTPDYTPPTITDLAVATFLDETDLQDIESLLESKKQLIFEGPPGSGKTFVAQKFARYITGQSMTGKRNERVELVQFHQSYSYEDFVEGIRPETVDGQLHYNVKPGIFRQFANKAWSDLENPYVLIIDEINRGNVSRILGELMLLLEYRDETATLPYSQQELSIPPNLYIIGTMNSADRSLSQIDYALRRRFYFVRFLSVENGQAKVLGRWLDTQNLEPDQRHRILRTFIELNAQLRSHLDTDDLQIGHSYFMNPNIGNEDFRKQVWKYAVIPLIREYLYHHRDRDELLQSYELQRLIRIVQPIAEETGETTERLIQEASAEAPE